MNTGTDSFITLVYFLLGSNMGNREEFLRYAREELQLKAGILKASSTLYETEAWGFECTDLFINQVILMECNKKPHELLGIIHHIESEAGRIRSGTSYSSRTLDIDILFYGDQIVNTDDLVIPHPRLHLRRFCLVPLLEISPEFTHPVFLKSMETMLSECPDQLHVYPIKDSQ